MRNAHALEKCPQSDSKNTNPTNHKARFHLVITVNYSCLIWHDSLYYNNNYNYKGSYYINNICEKSIRIIIRHPALKNPRHSELAIS